MGDSGVSLLRQGSARLRWQLYQPSLAEVNACELAVTHLYRCASSFVISENGGERLAEPSEMAIMRSERTPRRGVPTDVGEREGKISDL